ncbi:MAG: hypothetical protein GXY55_14460 [Phycisphaerae bacterium]|nr:hypothetical protein [Phycisphaerae bacterium]
MMKRLYHGLALIALINLFAVGGLVGYLFASGRLNEERLNQIGEVLRGEYPRPEAVATQPAEPPPPPQSSREEIATMQARRDFYQLVGERHRRESADRADLEDSVHLRILRRLEEIEQRNQEFQQQKQEFVKQSEQEGFTQVLEMYSTMDPKQAKDLLRLKEKEADVVRIIMQMDPNRRKRIINACKTEDERLWIGRILNQIAEVNKQ